MNERMKPVPWTPQTQHALNWLYHAHQIFPLEHIICLGDTVATARQETSWTPPSATPALPKQSAKTNHLLLALKVLLFTTPPGPPYGPQHPQLHSHAGGQSPPNCGSCL